MTQAITLHTSSLAIHRKTAVKLAGNLNFQTPAKILQLKPRKFTILAVNSPENISSTSSQPSISPEFTSSVGSPPSLQFTLTQRHFTVLNVATCAVAISMTCLFCAAIPTLLAFKRAAESLEKLLDVTREELPGTMAAVRLSGMEISDLTTELSDLGRSTPKPQQLSLQQRELHEEYERESEKA